MIGVWSGEWNAYYQSWDGKYFNAYNEDIWLDSYDQFLEIRLANPADSPTTQAETAEEYLETARALGLSTESVWFVDIEVRKVTVCTRNCEPIIYSEGETITVPEISEDLSIDVSRVLPPADRMSGE